MNEDKTTQIRNIITLFFVLIGVILSVLSLGAELLGLDITPGFGVVQMFQLLLGLTCLTLAGFLYLTSLQPPDAPRSLQADIGIRLAATGLVFTYASGFSDLIGIGTHIQPDFDRPFVGPLQLGGLVLGGGVIVAGMLLYHTSRRRRDTSSMEFIVNGNSKP